MDFSPFSEAISAGTCRHNLRTQAQRKIYPKCGLDQLPNDVVQRILRFLPRNTILSATLVCRRWNVLISESEMLDGFTLKVAPSDGGGDPEECPRWPVKSTSSADSYGDEPDELSLEYGYYLNRSIRTYRNIALEVRDQHMFLVAVMALRKFGRHLVELRLTLDLRNQSSYFLRHFERMKELEMGFEEYDQMLWEQEVDSYDRCLRPIALPPEQEHMLRQPDIEEILERDFRRVEEVFLSLVYRYCFRLQTLLVRRLRLGLNSKANVFLYEGTEMERLTELGIYGTGFIILADAPNLRRLTIHGVTSGLPFYSGFRHAFPHLEVLEIVDDPAFNYLCLWQLSKRCYNLAELTLCFPSGQLTKLAFHYLGRLKHLAKLSVTMQDPYDPSHYIFEDWPEMTIERLFISAFELRVDNIYEMLARNRNLKEFVVSTRRRIPYSMIGNLQQFRPGCRLTCLQVAY
uniref:F-box domain-containing protein n=1 Tax=Culex tarsalis TaxID=7177 RepID=A0A1Q3EVS4_CULTA